MTAVLLAPHHDDETLFASFTICRERPKVIIVTRSDLQEQRGDGVTDQMRQDETRMAMFELFGGFGFELDFWQYSDADPDWGDIQDRIGDELGGFDHVYAPAVEVDGHPHHNELGEIADVTFAWSKVTHYTTYTQGRCRSATNRPVEYEPEWLQRKLRALACYRSQIGLWPHHFIENQAEYYSR